jgi:hypothetical protein
MRKKLERNTIKIVTLKFDQCKTVEFWRWMDYHVLFPSVSRNKKGEALLSQKWDSDLMTIHTEVTPGSQERC